MAKDTSSKLVSGCGIALVAYLLALLIAGLIGCKPAKVIGRYKASSAFAGDCSDSFPPRIDTNYLPGGVVHDTVVVVERKTDTLGNHYQIIETRRTIRDTLILRVKDRAKEVELERLITEHQSQAAAVIEGLKQQQKKELEKFLKGLDQVEKSGAKNAEKLAKRTKQRNWLFFVVLGAGLWQFRHLLIRVISKQ